MKRYLFALLKGLLAGASISVGGMLFVLSKAYLERWGQFVGAMCFPVGLILVCFFGFYLYTGKIGYVLTIKDRNKYIIDLVIMLVGNIVSSFVIGFVLRLMLEDSVNLMDAIKAIMAKKTPVISVEFCFNLLLTSIICGALVYIAVYFFKTFKNVIFKVIGIIIPIFTFVYMGMDHCIANAFYFGFGDELGNVYMYLYLFIAIVGNSIGAIIINYINTKKVK